MSKDDLETRQTLITPHIEIEKSSNKSLVAHVNVDTFKECLGQITLARSEKGPQEPDSDSFYHVYGVVSRPVGNILPQESYVNISEPPVSRTLMGYLEKSILMEKLPNVYKALTPE